LDLTKKNLPSGNDKIQKQRYSKNKTGLKVSGLNYLIKWSIFVKAKTQGRLMD